jgi:DNA mismatch endonuclease (patch repair protein)
MASVKSTENSSTEERLARILRANSIWGWRRHLPLLGKQDFTFRASRVLIFGGRCFWHGCPQHVRIPTSNRRYRVAKIERNKAGDRKNVRLLRDAVWSVLRLWEHELKHETRVASNVQRILGMDNE